MKILAALTFATLIGYATVPPPPSTMGIEFCPFGPYAWPCGKKVDPPLPAPAPCPIPTEPRLPGPEPGPEVPR